MPFDPAANRIFVRFKDAGNVTRGSTSVALRTQETSPSESNLSRRPKRVRFYFHLTQTLPAIHARPDDFVFRIRVLFCDEFREGEPWKH